MMSLSNNALCSLPCVSTYSTLTSLPLLMVPIFTPISIARPCFRKSLCASLATVSSTAPKNTGMASSMVTSEPKRRHTLPISKPITPAPITPNRLGTASMANAPVFDRICFSSNGAPGNSRGIEPVAITTCLAVNVSADAPLTAI